MDLNKAFDSIDGFDGNGDLGCRMMFLQHKRWFIRHCDASR